MPPHLLRIPNLHTCQIPTAASGFECSRGLHEARALSQVVWLRCAEAPQLVVCAVSLAAKPVSVTPTATTPSSTRLLIAILPTLAVKVPEIKHRPWCFEGAPSLFFASQKAETNAHFAVVFSLVERQDCDFDPSANTRESTGCDGGLALPVSRFPSRLTIVEPVRLRFCTAKP